MASVANSNLNQSYSSPNSISNAIDVWGDFIDRKADFGFWEESLQWAGINYRMRPEC